MFESIFSVCLCVIIFVIEYRRDWIIIRNFFFLVREVFEFINKVNIFDVKRWGYIVKLLWFEKCEIEFVIVIEICVY